MLKSIYNQGQKLDAVWCPMDSDGGHSGARVGYDEVTSITVAQACGPMGFYDVAVILREGTGRAKEIIPLHMAEIIVTDPGDQEVEHV